MDSIDLHSEQAGIGIRQLTPHAIAADAETHAHREAWTVSIAAHGIDPRSMTASATIHNTGNRTLRFSGIRWQDSDALRYSFAFPPEYRPICYSSENYRRDSIRSWFSEGNAFHVPLGNQILEIGSSEDSVFPGFFVTGERIQAGFFCAQATQSRLQALYRFRGYSTSRKGWLFEMEERPKGDWTIDIPAGGSYTGETFYFHISHTDNPQDATAGYYAHLRATGAFERQKKNPLHSQRIYCSWNFDFFHSITEEDLLGQIPVIQTHFPSVRFLQLDHGYQHRYAPDHHAMIDLCYKVETPFRPDAFPSGPKGLADRIRASGMRPALWLGLWADLKSTLVAEHPEWILQDDTGGQMLLPKRAVLDPSQDAVLEYLDHAAKTIFRDWGFEGLKLDFGTFAFNSTRARYRKPGRTAAEMRHTLESLFSKDLPVDGLFGWRCQCGTVHPFLSQADYFRCCSDIGHGQWEAIKWVGRWLGNTVLLMPESPCLPNLDSLGWCAAFGSEAQWMTWLNLGAVSGMALEISGDLRKLPPERCERIRKALELSHPGGTLRVLDLPVPPISAPASAWLNTRKDGRALLGLFNWTDEERHVPIRYPQLGQAAGAWRDAWTGEPLDAGEMPAGILLAPHESRLFGC